MTQDDSSEDRKTQSTTSGDDTVMMDNSGAVSFSNSRTTSFDNNDNDHTRRRRPFVSIHRQELDRIKTDQSHSRTHPVPTDHHHRDRDRDHDSSIHNGNGNHNISNNGLHGNGSNSNNNSAACRRRCSKLAQSVTQAIQSKGSCSDWTETFLPMWRWLKVYEWKSTLTQDIIAGCTVGVMIVPQSMSYAKLAGLPVQYGLYSALVPVYAYALFGSSRQLAVGPVALISLLLSTGLAPIMAARNLDPNNADSKEQYEMVYATLAIQTSFLVGIVYVAMGLCRLGFVTIFLSHAVISGFTTGAAVIIGCSQLKYIFGYPVERSDRIYEILYHLFENISQFNYKTFLMGTFSILALVVMKHLGKTYKKLKWMRAMGPLTVTVIAIILTAACNLEERGIPIVGHIPKGLPSFTASAWTPVDNNLWLTVISIVIVGFMESIAIAKQLASKHKYEIDSSLELVGLGMANFFGSMFQSYPVTGSFSRSAVNNESGAQSGISGIVTATLVGLVLLFLTPVFEKLPLNTLAAIVISGVLGLLDYPEAIALWNVHKFDFAVWMIAWLGTMFLGVEIGLAIAVGVSLLIVIYESAYPHTAVLGRLPGTTVYRNVKQYPEAERYDGVVIVRIDAPLFFANAQNVRDKIRKYRLLAEDEVALRNGNVKYLVIDCTPVSHVDTSALHILEDMDENYKSRGQQLCFSNPSLNVMERFVKSGFADQVGREHFFSCTHDALNWCLNEMDIEAVSIHESVHGNESQGDGDSDAMEAEATTDSDGDQAERAMNGSQSKHEVSEYAL